MGFGLHCDVDTDDQGEDQEHQPLLFRPRAHLAPAGRESARENWWE